MTLILPNRRKLLTGAAAVSISAALPSNATLAFVHGGPARILSGPIIVSADNQIVENLNINSTESGITVNGHSGVIIRNCLIHYGGSSAGMGIQATDCTGMTIEHCTTTCDANVAPGQGANADLNGVLLSYCNSVVVSYVTTKDSSVGVRAEYSDSVVASFLLSIDSRGPFPRGQGLQFSWCTNCTLQDFWVNNDLSKCWTEDNVSVGASTGTIIQRGLITGNNSPTGSGVMVELGSTGVVSDVDVLNWSNVAFGAADAVGVQFIRCRARGWYAPLSQNRGVPSSGGLIFMSYFGTATGTIFRACKYYDAPTSINGSTPQGGGVLWDTALCAETDVVLTNFMPLGPYGISA